MISTKRNYSYSRKRRREFEKNSLFENWKASTPATRDSNTRISKITPCKNEPEARKRRIMLTSISDHRVVNRPRREGNFYAEKRRRKRKKRWRSDLCRGKTVPLALHAVFRVICGSIWAIPGDIMTHPTGEKSIPVCECRGGDPGTVTHARKDQAWSCPPEFAGDFARNRQWATRRWPLIRNDSRSGKIGIVFETKGEDLRNEASFFHWMLGCQIREDDEWSKTGDGFSRRVFREGVDERIIV